MVPERESLRVMLPTRSNVVTNGREGCDCRCNREQQDHGPVGVPLSTHEQLHSDALAAEQGFDIRQASSAEQHIIRPWMDPPIAPQSGRPRERNPAQLPIRSETH